MLDETVINSTVNEISSDQSTVNEIPSDEI